MILIRAVCVCSPSKAYSSNLDTATRIDDETSVDSSLCGSTGG